MPASTLQEKGCIWTSNILVQKMLLETSSLVCKEALRMLPQIQLLQTALKHVLSLFCPPWSTRSSKYPASPHFAWAAKLPRAKSHLVSRAETHRFPGTSCEHSADTAKVDGRGALTL